MPASRYDIEVEQGSTWKLFMTYKYKGGTGIDLSNFGGAMQVRRSQKDDDVILFLTQNGVTGGGITGEFTVGVNGVAGIGGISFNTSISGALGNTGGILFKVDHNTMKNVPAGRHFYDFELINSLGEVTRFLEGSFTCTREITRT
jgi:hypothetical protein